MWKLLLLCASHQISVTTAKIIAGQYRYHQKATLDNKIKITVSRRPNSELFKHWCKETTITGIYSRYLCYFRDLKNGTIITKGEVFISENKSVFFSMKAFTKPTKKFQSIMPKIISWYHKISFIFVQKFSWWRAV